MLVLCGLVSASSILGVQAHSEADNDIYQGGDQNGFGDLQANMNEIDSSSTSRNIDPIKRQQLLEKYGNKPFTVHLDSIEPEAGPITGGTRVLVRGGPFKEVDALFPRPKCKFGRNNLIVDATYVSCSLSPTPVNLREGRHAEKVSRLREA
jgi:hypothetical protein